MAIKHKYVSVNSDEREAAKFEGDLADFAAEKLNEFLAGSARGARVVGVESEVWVREVRPKPSDSSTWYDRTYMRLSVWYESADDLFVLA